MEQDRKHVDSREAVRVITSNEFISVKELSSLSLNARKLLYLAIAQCRMDDSIFYEYEVSPSELAEMWGVTRQQVYQVADEITDELMKIVLRFKGDRKFSKRHLFYACSYDENSMITFQIHKDMADLFLGLKRDFSKPLLWDFMKMRSSYSMAIWHLMQKEMKSFKPAISAPIEFDLTLEELRAVTGTERKFKQVGQFKQYVLDKALKEIKKNCWVDITYENIKDGRTVIGFRFTAVNVFGGIDRGNMSHRLKQRLRRAQLIRKKSEEPLTQEEQEELDFLTEELSQLSLEDIINNYPID